MSSPIRRIQLRILRKMHQTDDDGNTIKGIPPRNSATRDMRGMAYRHCWQREVEVKAANGTPMGKVIYAGHYTKKRSTPAGFTSAPQYLPYHLRTLPLSAVRG